MGPAGELVEVVGKGLLRRDVVAPDDRVADHEHLSCREIAAVAAVEPVVAAELVRDAVVIAGPECSNRSQAAGASRPAEAGPADEDPVRRREPEPVRGDERLDGGGSSSIGF